MVTPTSQIVGSQAVSVALDRKKGNPDYSNPSNQFISLIKGEYGKTPVPVDPAFREKITGSPVERPYDVSSYKKPENPVLEDLGGVKLASNDEEYLLLELLPSVANGFLRRRRTEEHKVAALKSVNIEIEKGEFIVVLGHNGSGKSTFAKHINALLQPTGGTLWVKGMNTQEEGQVWDIRQTAGMVFQNPDNQLVATVVEEDIAFGPENMGVPSEQIRMRVDEALDAVRMGEFATYTPSKLSGGQKQRIAIAGVLAMKPDCIVLDEPTAMLDPVG